MFSSEEWDYFFNRIRWLPVIARVTTRPCNIYAVNQFNGHTGRQFPGDKRHSIIVPRIRRNSMK